jgi:hypothetical protein
MKVVEQAGVSESVVWRVVGRVDREARQREQEGIAAQIDSQA